ncbi:TPA: hypothetical protein HA251_05580 [Candidatus Woesearchaeota archaeon]|nr:hypothetical protein [Candidatus Woesearchaeota archaeon]
MAGTMRKHEVLGLFYQFLGATSIGIGIFNAVWYAVRPLKFGSLTALPAGWDWAVFPLFFGIGAILWSLGAIELKDVEPTSRGRR